MQKYMFIYVSFIPFSIFAEDLPYISNYGWRCMYCICKATLGGCDHSLLCNEGYCGALRISRIYWVDAGNITMPGDSPERNNAYEDCSLHFPCAQKILWGYFQRYATDCNNDGVTNCDDYALLHFNRFMCHRPINRSEYGRNWWKNYTECDPLDRKPIGVE